MPGRLSFCSGRGRRGSRAAAGQSGGRAEEARTRRPMLRLTSARGEAVAESFSAASRRTFGSARPRRARLPAPRARLTSARRGVPSRERAKEDAGAEMPGPSLVSSGRATQWRVTSTWANRTGARLKAPEARAAAGTPCRLGASPPRARLTLARRGAHRAITRGKAPEARFRDSRLGREARSTSPIAGWTVTESRGAPAALPQSVVAASVRRVRATGASRRRERVCLGGGGGAPSRDLAAEDAEVGRPRQRARMKSPIASPDVAAQERTAPAGQ